MSADAIDAVRMPTLFWFNRFDERIGILRPTGSVVHTQELCGQDTLEFSCMATPTKGDRLVWRDPADGRWREHVVVRTDEGLVGACLVYAESSLCDLLSDYIEETHLVSATISKAMSDALLPSRWGVGEIVGSFSAAGAMFYHVNCLAALRRIEELWDCEIEPVVSVVANRVATRSVRVARKLGGWHGVRFVYGQNMAGCTRTVCEDEVYTALYGYGAGLPIADDDGHLTGGYRRKLTFGDINGGKNWVGNDAAREEWGLWNADRTAKMHRFGEVTFSDIDDKYLLRAKTTGALRSACVPRVCYEVDAVAVAECADVDLGDEVAVVDSVGPRTWRLRARVVKRERTFGDALRVRVSIGTVKETAYAAAADVGAAVVAVADAAGAACDGVVATTASVAVLESAAGVVSGEPVPALASEEYVDAAIAALEDLSEVAF